MPSPSRSVTALVSAAVSANRSPAAVPSRAALRAAGIPRAKTTNGTQSAPITPPTISHSPSGASSRPPDGFAIVRKRISEMVTRAAAPASTLRILWPVSLAPSGSAKTTAETSSGWTTASRPIVSAAAWATKPRPSAAIPASHTGRRAIRTSRPELDPSVPSSSPARCRSTVPSANSNAATRARTISIAADYSRRGDCPACSRNERPPLPTGTGACRFETGAGPRSLLAGLVLAGGIGLLADHVEPAVELDVDLAAVVEGDLDLVVALLVAHLGLGDRAAPGVRERRGARPGRGRRRRLRRRDPRRRPRRRR